MIIDIREKNEVKEEKIEGAINLPLSEKENLNNFITKFEGKITIICRSGKRSSMFVSGLSDDNKAKCTIYEGGILKYSKNNKTIKGKIINLSILGQALLATSILLIILTGLGVILNSAKYYIFIAFVSVDICCAGLSGNCLMANILSRMPWNK